MKHLLAWKPRLGGSGPDNELAFDHALQTFGKWERPGDVVFHHFLQRLDSEGGFAIVETDNDLSLLHMTNKFVTWFEFTLTPVIEFEQGLPAFSEGLEFRKKSHS